MTTLEQLRQKQKELLEKKQASGGEGKQSEFASFTQPSNMVRILPGKDNPLDFFVESAIHKIEGADGKFVYYHCRRTQNEKCPICDYVFELWDTHKALKLGKGSDGKQIKSKYGTMGGKLKAKPRYYVKVVVRDLVDKGEDPVKFVAMSDELFNIVMAGVTDPDLADESDPENTTMLSLEHGNDFEIKITKQGEYNSFKESKVKIKKSKAGTPKQIAEWLESKLDLRTLVKISDYDEGKKIVENIRASLNTVASAQTPPQKTEEDDDDSKFKDNLKA